MFGWFQGPFWLRTPTSSIRWKTREALALPGPRNLLAGIPEPGNSKVRKIWNATKNRWLTLANYSGLVGLFWVNCPGFINVIGCYIQIIPVNLCGIILSKYNDLIVLSGMIEYDSKGRLSQSQTFQVNEWIRIYSDVSIDEWDTPLGAMGMEPLVSGFSGFSIQSEGNQENAFTFYYIFCS